MQESHYFIWLVANTILYLISEFVTRSSLDRKPFIICGSLDIHDNM